MLGAALSVKCVTFCVLPASLIPQSCRIASGFAASLFLFLEAKLLSCDSGICPKFPSSKTLRMQSLGFFCYPFIFPKTGSTLESYGEHPKK